MATTCCSRPSCWWTGATRCTLSCARTACSAGKTSPPLPAGRPGTAAARALQAASGTAGRLDRHRQTNAGTGRHGRGIVRRCVLPAGAEPPVGLEPAAVAPGQIGLALGADVPFFLRGRNAWVRVSANILHPADHLPPARFAVVKPPTGLETAIFNDPGAKRGQNCYNLRLCCKPVWFWPATTCSRLPKGFAPR
jgi:hypothetical protein